MCEASGLTAVEPLWGESTESLFHDWVSSGAEALIVTARAELLDDTWLGRALRADLLPELKRLGVDPCGERGEYHTVVTNCSMFSRPLGLQQERRVQNSGCWALDVVPLDDPPRSTSGRSG
jgi:diphthamide synthase (EF-2-diphthine--ammonia ligase)